MTAAAWDRERRAKIAALEEEWEQHELAIAEIKMKIYSLEDQDIDEARADARFEARKAERAGEY